ncbi:MAG: helix-turn-helix domain-containing protein, partial [Bacteroidota bacterium]|nr:helix-turn-helix domain-containing protein [Bacteroidota bacterium]
MKKEIEKKSVTEFCPIRNILDRFGDKWSILVIITLGKNGKMRFNELNNAINDISQKMLTVTLRTLEADGLLTRTIYPQIPPKVEYELTEM